MPAIQRLSTQPELASARGRRVARAEADAAGAEEPGLAVGVDSSRTPPRATSGAQVPLGHPRPAAQSEETSHASPLAPGPTQVRAWRSNPEVRSRRSGIRRQLELPQGAPPPLGARQVPDVVHEERVAPVRACAEIGLRRRRRATAPRTATKAGSVFSRPYRRRRTRGDGAAGWAAVGVGRAGVARFGRQRDRCRRCSSYPARTPRPLATGLPDALIRGTGSRAHVVGTARWQ